MNPGLIFGPPFASGVRRDDAESVDQRQRVHVAFLADALDEVERPFDLGAREVDGIQEQAK